MCVQLVVMCVQLVVMCVQLVVMCVQLVVMCVQLVVVCVQLVVMCVQLVVMCVQLVVMCVKLTVLVVRVPLLAVHTLLLAELHLVQYYYDNIASRNQLPLQLYMHFEQLQITIINYNYLVHDSYIMMCMSPCMVCAYIIYAYRPQYTNVCLIIH